VRRDGDERGMMKMGRRRNGKDEGSEERIGGRVERGWGRIVSGLEREG
jgi:hypothetical protein